ncbi:hypothetical protein [Edwardsiella anguillarum]|uniref:Uncharacterized protein n=1 Tax=Edwardsiella anguillarum ET080813 TaxID=667120 RepID=A0A076LRU8_9GAMM|nr:hypothetical protein [Edwardsiella anguillarum]AIJ09268.1 Hypothetical protein ETEE_2835 [Edwardsiella anguillarum ET080813]KAB0589401.1 hypothetical protein F7P84_14375 [Edwardsiella anguillarum]
MDYNTLLGIIGGLGIGTILNSIMSNFLAKKTKQKERLYEEKKSAYLGLLSAIHKAAAMPSETTAKEYALWQTHCSLFGSPEVALFAQKMIDTNDGPSTKRHEAFDGLIQAMRSDLAK